MVAMKNGGTFPFYIYESPDQYSNPTNIVWRDSGYINIGGGNIADLDRDNMKEVIYRYYWDITHRDYTTIYESNGDNQYNRVWCDSINKSANFAIGDFDLDGKKDFVTGFTDNGGGWVHVWECEGDNNYQMVFRDTITNGNNNYDIFSAHDLDSNGKPEFLFTAVDYFYGTARLFCYEMVDDNIYDYYLIDSITNLPFGISEGKSICGDVDRDGIEEIIWSSINQWHIYKAIGIHQFQCIYSSAWTSHGITNVSIHDLNGNGYPEVIENWEENGIPARHAVVIWEIEGVRLHQPNGWEVLNPGQQFNITWEKFDPPGADSFALFFSADNGRSFDTVATGLSDTDTFYLWTVPNAISNSCKIMIWAYGPPRSGENASRGTAWDFSDTLFFIRPVTVSENNPVELTNIKLEVHPNPFTDQTSFRIRGHQNQAGLLLLHIYDIAGREVISMPIHINGDKSTTAAWDGKNKTGEKIPRGIYFLQISNQSPINAVKIIKY